MVATALKELNHLEIPSRMICDDIVDDDFSVEVLMLLHVSSMILTMLKHPLKA